MSYSTIYKVYKTKLTAVQEFRNGWGSGAALWDFLARKHLNDEYEFAKGYKRTWALFYNGSIPEHHRIALAFSFDNALCKPENIQELAAACEKIGPEITAWEPNRANHWGAFAECLRKIEGDKRMLGVALNCTSVSDLYDGDARKIKWYDMLPLETRAA